MQIFTPEVKDISLFKEIAKNVVNPLEVIREAISNSHDAEAKQISILIWRDVCGKFMLEVQDDGNGMDINSIHRFFNLGDSLKYRCGIGHKGLGTKTFFKSRKIIITTRNKENEAYKAVMEEPWEVLNSNSIPQYSIEKISMQPGMYGTIIKIEGYIIDYPEKYFNFETIKDYILWFTAGGSFKTYFANYTELHKYIKNMQIAPRIYLEDKILGIKEEIAGTHQFWHPQEKPIYDPFETIYKKSVNYCRHFGPYHKATNINGDYVSFQIYGTISGINCRRQICKLRRGESVKSRFGVYLCKDFIPIKKMDLINEKNYYHYHLLVNSQAFELTADRNNISNLDNPKVKWVIEEARRIINEDIKPLAQEGYFKLRKYEELEYFIKMKCIKTQKRLDSYEEMDNLLISDLPLVKKPDSEGQVAILFTAMLANQNFRQLIKYINRIGHYSQNSATDMICLDNNNNKVLVEIEFKLSNLFRHEHPYDTFDYVVCWTVDMEINEKKKLQDGTVLNLIYENDEWLLKYGTQKIIPIIELRTLLNNAGLHSSFVEETR